MLVPDGVYLTETDPPYFRKAPTPTAAELQTLVQTIGERIGRRLERTGKLNFYYLDNRDLRHRDGVLHDCRPQ
jgi:hypothetical protein